MAAALRLKKCSKLRPRGTHPIHDVKDMAHKPYPLEPESESCRHATQPGTSFPDKYELAGKLGTVVKQAGESSILIMLDSGGEWRIDLDRVAVTSHSIGCRSWRSDMQMVPFRLNLFGLLALWLQRLTYTEAKGGPGFDSGTSRPQRRRGEGRSADAPSPSAHSASPVPGF